VLIPADYIVRAKMLELAKMLILKDLPTGVIVATAVIEKCKEAED